MKHKDRTRDYTAPEYAAWASMKSRCSDSKVQCWDHYGGRGIKVCDEWRTYEQFLADMGRRPSPKHSLERVDNDGDYAPGNCRWANRIEQARNKRSNRLLKHNGQVRCVAEWCELLGLKEGTVHARLSRGWSDGDALKQPMRLSGFGCWVAS